MIYLNEEKIYMLNRKIENAIFNGEFPKYNLEDVFALHEALMVLQQLVKLGIIEFDEEGLVIKNGNIKDKASE
jgi:hypothetical protein